MAMTGGIGNMLSAVDKTAGVNAGNPQKLQKEVGQGKNQDMVKALALQQVKSDYEAAARNTQMQMEQSPKNVLQQREDEVMNLAMQQVMGDAKTGQAVNQKAQGKAQQGMMKNALAQQQQQGAPRPQGMPQRPPQGIAQQQAMPQGAPAQSMPRSGMTPMGMAGPTRRAATGGLMRYAEGGSVEEEKKKKGKTGFEKIKENPVKGIAGALGAVALATPIGRMVGGGARGAYMAGKAALPFAKRGLSKLATKPNPNVLQGATRKGTPLSPDRVVSPSRIAGTGSAGLFGYDYLTSPQGGEEAPEAAPEAAPAPQQGQGIASQPKPKPPQLSALEQHRQNKPALPQQAPQNFSSRFNTFAMNLADTPLTRAGRAVRAESAQRADQEFKRALAERETWATELQMLTQQDISKVSNLKDYGVKLQTMAAGIATTLTEGSGIENLKMMAAQDPDNEELQARLAKEDQDLKDAIIGALNMNGLSDTIQEVNKALKNSLGISGQGGLNLNAKDEQLVANFS
tara:strand:+ start:319 stop:1860 length:1542 start_codon:yes stop_codon:yes gene_type:complete